MTSDSNLHAENAALRQRLSELEVQLAQHTSVDTPALETSVQGRDTLLQAILNGAPGFIIVHDLQGNFLYANRRWPGQSLETLRSTNLLDVVHPNCRELALAAFHEAVQNQTVQRSEQLALTASGEYRWGEVIYSPIIVDGKVAQVAAFVTDIHERKLAQEALLASEEKYRSLVESSTALIAVFDTQGKLQYINSLGAAYMGRSQEDLLGKTLPDLLPEELANDYSRHVQQVISGNTGLVYDIYARQRWYHTSVQPVRDSTGKAVMVLFNATDITDLKTAQAELLELNRTLERRVHQRSAEVQDLYDNAPCGYHSLDRNGTFLMINQTELNWLGYTREEVVGHMKLSDILTPEGRRQFAEKFPIFLAQGWIKDLEYDFVCKDGSLVPVLLSATAIYDERGEYIMNRVTVFDNSEQKKAHQALRASEDRLNFLLSNTPAIIFTARVEKDPPITFISDSVYSTLGYTPRQYLEQPEFWLKTVHPDDLENGAVVIQALLENTCENRHAIWEYRVRRADGEYRWMSTGVGLVRDAQGQPQEIIGYTVDINEQKKAEEALRISEARLRQIRDDLSAANAALEKAARLKDEFLASMSHELRTPLTGILGLSEALQMKVYGELNEKQVTTLKNIESSGQHLLELINDILDLSKIEAGKLDMQFEPCSLTGICQASLHLTKGLAHKKRQKVAYSSDPPTIIVSADPRRLKQMLVNLLGNAVKFTPEDGKLGLEVRGCADERVVRLSVWDQGIGIKPEDLERLFKPFVQLDSSLARQHSGSGLGLSLVRRLAELHGGSVQVESTPGEGSRFTITLPWSGEVNLALPISFQSSYVPPRAPSGLAETAAASAIQSKPAQPGLGRIPTPKVLLADDNPIILETLADYLKSQNYQVIIARNGQELIELAVESHPDIILLDIQMPGMDGFEAARRIRAHPDVRVAKAPMIAITALVMPGDRQRCLAAGINEYLSKPIRLDQLDGFLKKLLLQ